MQICIYPVVSRHLYAEVLEVDIGTDISNVLSIALKCDELFGIHDWHSEQQNTEACCRSATLKKLNKTVVFVVRIKDEISRENSAAKDENACR